MTPTKVKKGDIIYQQHRYPNDVYFIVKGKINCLNKENVTFKNYVENSYFGEIEILKNH
jgi:hypothetical protein